MTSDIESYTEYQTPINQTHLENLDVLLKKLTSKQGEDVSEQMAVLFALDNFSGTTTTYNYMKSSGKMALMTEFIIAKTFNKLV